MRHIAPGSKVEIKVDAVPDVTFKGEVEAISTATTFSQPRLRNSRLMAPVPAKRSRAVQPSKSRMFSSTLNMFSRAKSVVGRAVMLRGTSKRRRPYFPRIILIAISFCELTAPRSARGRRIEPASRGRGAGRLTRSRGGDEAWEAVRGVRIPRR